MILTLLLHQWKAFWRSRGAGKALIFRLLVGFVLLYFLATGLALGLYMPEILLHFFPGQDLVTVFCSLLLYYFSIDLVVRFLFQDLPVLATRPYLLQNISRRRLVSFVDIRSLFHFLNLLPVLIFFPFIVAVIRTDFGNIPAVALTGSVTLLILLNHFLILYIKRRSVFNPWWLVAFVAVTILLFLLPLRTVSSVGFFHTLHHPWLALVFIFPPALVYLVNRRFLHNNLYFEELSGHDSYKQSAEYNWLRRWGVTGELIGLEYRLILRNRKPRIYLLFSLATLAYCAVFSRPNGGHPVSAGMLFFFCITANGALLIRYGGQAFAWQSSHFDGLHTSNIQTRDYIRSKFYVFTIIATLTYIISLLYGLLDLRALPMLTAAWLYNVGCNIPVAAWCATFDYQPIDLGKGVGFNYGGTTAAHGWYITLISLPPFLIYLAFSWLFQPWAGITAVGAAGGLCLLFRRWFIHLVTQEFFQRKYLILQAFREK